MIDFPAWLQDPNVDVQEAASQAALSWHAIQDKPVSVAFRTGAGVTLPAQIVRLEYLDVQSQLVVQSVTGISSARRLFVFGVRGHPDPNILDTVMEEGYRFVYGDDEYTIIDTLMLPGEIQGIAEARG